MRPVGRLSTGCESTRITPTTNSAEYATGFTVCQGTCTRAQGVHRRVSVHGTRVLACPEHVFFRLTALTSKVRINTS